MKKKNLKKLSLKKVRISMLEEKAVSGGFDTTVLPTETIEFTACYGNRICQFYRTDADCGETFTC